MNYEINKQRASVILTEEAYNLAKQAQDSFLETIENSEIYKLIKNDEALLQTFVISCAANLLDKIFSGMFIKYGRLDLQVLDNCLKEIRSTVIENFN